MATKRCRRCEQDKPREDFYKSDMNRDGLGSYCKPCHKAICDDARTRDPERYRVRWAETNRRRQADDPEKVRAWRRNAYNRKRNAVFDHYGWICACCGSAENPSIDHINGDGHKLRLELSGDPHKSGGDKVYRWIIEQGFPDDLQTLCMTCNNSKRGGTHCRIHVGDLRVRAVKALLADGMTYRQIAEVLGISASRASQLAREVV